jgi:SnoaL-like domain
MDVLRNTPDAELWYAIYSLVVNYWRDVDFNEGHAAHDYYVADGAFIVGDNRFEAHDGIRTFYSWRRRREKFGTRHLVSDVVVVADGDRRATGAGVVTLYRATGRPPFRNTVPTLVADFTCDCVRGDDERWRFGRHVVDPLFIGDDVPLSLSVNTKHLDNIKNTIANNEHGAERTLPPRVG